MRTDWSVGCKGGRIIRQKTIIPVGPRSTRKVKRFVRVGGNTTVNVRVSFGCPSQYDGKVCTSLTPSPSDWSNYLSTRCPSSSFGVGPGECGPGSREQGPKSKET